MSTKNATKAQAIALIEPYADALVAYKAEQGRNWQNQLMDDWMYDHRRQWGDLRRLRNDVRFGGIGKIFAAFEAYEKAQEAKV